MMVSLLAAHSSRPRCHTDRKNATSAVCSLYHSSRAMKMLSSGPSYPAPTMPGRISGVGRPSLRTFRLPLIIWGTEKGGRAWRRWGPVGEVGKADFVGPSGPAIVRPGLPLGGLRPRERGPHGAVDGDLGA